MFFVLPFRTLSASDRLFNCPPGKSVNFTYDDISKFETIQFCKNIVRLEVSGLITSIPAAFAREVENLQEVSLGPKVDTINSNSFYGCTKLTTINLDKIKVLGESAFENCKSLTLITLKNPELALIPKKCFSGCIKLATVDIGQDLKHYIDQLAFSTCYGIKSIHLYKNCSLTAFTACVGLETITVQVGPFDSRAFLGLKIKNVHMIEKTNYCDVDGVYFSDSQCTKLAYYPPYHEGKVYKVPAGVTHFLDSCFHSVTTLEGLEFTTQTPNIILGSNVFTKSTIQTIDLHWFSEITPTEGAFNTLPELKKVILIDGTKFIQPKMFQNCLKLQEINLEVISAFPEAIFQNTGLTVIKLEHDVDLTQASIFEGCPYLKTVSLSKLTPLKLGKQVFMDCTELISLVVPGSDDFIFGESVFKNCRKLAELSDFGENCIFEAECFAHCVSVRSMIISPTSQIKNKAFYNTGFVDLRVTTFAKWTEILTFAETKKLENLIVGPTCTAIPDSAFLNSGVKNVSFYEPSTITSIGACAFQNTQISEIILPKSLTTISEGAFSTCCQLVCVKYEADSQITQISDVCFYGDLMLKEIQFPETVTQVGSDSFGNCTSLGKVVFNEKTAKILDRCFEYTGLKTIELPKLMTSLGLKAFYSCSLLTTVTFTGDSLTLLDDSCFLDCVNLEKVTIPETLTGVYSIGINCFANCLKLAEFSFVKCEKISSNAFAQSGLTGIHITTSIVTIEDASFLHCKSLQTAKLISDENSKFKFTMDKLLINSEENNVIQSFEIAELKEYNILETILTFEPSAFAGNEVVEKVSFKENKGINNIYFGGCKNLKSLVNFGNTEVSEGACQNCQLLETVAIGSAVFSIKSNAFLNCVALQSFSLESVREIGTSTFMGCSSFRTVTVGNLTFLGFQAFKSSGVETVDFGVSRVVSESCFEDTKSLKTFDGKIVSIIQDSAFKGSGLNSIIVDQKVTLETAAFQNCTNLKSFLSNKLGDKDIKPLVFSGSGIEGDIEVDGKLIGYRAFEKTKVKHVKTSHLTTLEPFAFSGCSNLQSFLSSNEGDITWTNPVYFNEEGHQFSECISLSEIKIDFVKTLPTEIFLRCKNLKSIKLLSIIKIGKYSFMDCTALERLEFTPEANEMYLESIEDGAFSGCTALSNIDFTHRFFAKLLKTIGKFAFNSTGLSGTLKIPIAAQTIINDASHDSLINLIFYNTPKVTDYTLEPNGDVDQNDRFIDVNGVIYYKKVIIINNEKVTIKNEVVAYPFGKGVEASFMRDITFIQMNAFVDQELTKLEIPFDWTGSKISKLAFRNPETNAKTDKNVVIYVGRQFSYVNYGNGEETWGKKVQIKDYIPPSRSTPVSQKSTPGATNHQTIIIIIGTLCGVLFIAVVVAIFVILKRKKIRNEQSTTNETLI